MVRHITPLFLCLSLFVLSVSTCSSPPRADLIFHNGKIFTARDSQETVKALAVREGRVLAAGDEHMVIQFKDSRSRMIDLQGRVIVPGFHDAHLHFWKGALLQAQVNLIGCTDKNEALQRIRSAAQTTPPGEWIVGRGWDHELWPDRQFPTSRDLDAIVPEHLVYLKRVDGHAAWVNQKVLDLLGYDQSSADMPGGKIIRYPGTTRPTGILVDKAYEILDNLVPVPPATRREAILHDAIVFANSLGITSITDNTDASLFADYTAIYQQNQLTLRINFWVDGNQDLDSLRNFFDSFEVDSQLLNTRLAKFYADGSMGSRSAFLIEPYNDDPGNLGLPQHPRPEFTELIRHADRKGWQIGVHAIGDAGNRLVLDAFTRLVQENSRPNRRWRIEHAQFVQPEDILRFRELGIIASMQPSHCISDMKWVPERLGERGQYCYSWRSMLDQGVVLAFGTDWPVEPLNPFLGIYAAVSRQDTLGNPAGGWYPEQKLTTGEALYAYTAAAAYAAGSDEWLGKLLPGYAADLVILDRDIFSAAPMDILHTRVLITYLAGRQVYPPLNDY